MNLEEETSSGGCNSTQHILSLQEKNIITMCLGSNRPSQWKTTIIFSIGILDVHGETVNNLSNKLFSSIGEWRIKQAGNCCYFRLHSSGGCEIFIGMQTEISCRSGVKKSGLIAAPSVWNHRSSRETQILSFVTHHSKTVISLVGSFRVPSSRIQIVHHWSIFIYVCHKLSSELLMYQIAKFHV